MHIVLKTAGISRESIRPMLLIKALSFFVSANINPARNGNIFPNSLLHSESCYGWIACDFPSEAEVTKDEFQCIILIISLLWGQLWCCCQENFLLAWGSHLVLCFLSQSYHLNQDYSQCQGWQIWVDRGWGTWHEDGVGGSMRCL